MHLRAEIGERMRDARQRTGLTVEAIASTMGVSPTTVNNWENGMFPTPEHLAKLADVYQFSIDWLVGRLDTYEDEELQALTELAAGLSPSRRRMLVELARELRG